ncbi:ABC transporter permease [Tengunoibacter tsumagoiensis]|uniref:Uncharacterized protein n=1 Tax=Tengunoibacter tsumagoiensis TaxID=2014871 RepID=A0A402A498_9CHLR|nr:hypothetical protein [Tengunoibacter tsumagoiensis]GCE13876.1 hypothetical protein KTT_37350 [Tengunoibacter tsumagoiensis]
MYGIRAIVRLELLVAWRGRAIWIVALFMTLLGVWTTAQVRSNPFDTWGQFSRTALIMTLVLSFVTGDQIARDRSHRVDGIFLGTPITTSAYVGAKFLAGIIIILGLAIIELIASLLMDLPASWQNTAPFLANSQYPPLGPQIYLVGWVWTILPALFLSASIMLIGITALRGQRIISSLIMIVLCLAPLVLFSNRDASPVTDWFDINSTSFVYKYPPDTTPATLFLETQRERLHFSPIGPPPYDVGLHILDLLKKVEVPANFPPSLLESRLLFIGLALFLFILTTAIVHRQRRGEA